MENEKPIISLNGKEKANINDETIQNVNKKGNLCLHDNNIFNLTELNLEILSLSNNLIIDLYENAFTNLSNLKQLYLDENKIESLNKNVFNSLKSLEILSFSNNLIKALDENV